jgi:hypothetical protein
MTSGQFIQVMKHFIHHTNSSKECQNLLLFYNHDSHLSVAVIDLARENGVTIVALLPHCTHKSQPLHVGVFRNLERTTMQQLKVGWCSIQDKRRYMALMESESCKPENTMFRFKKLTFSRLTGMLSQTKISLTVMWLIDIMPKKPSVGWQILQLYWLPQT